MASRNDRTWTNIAEETLDIARPALALLFDGDLGPVDEPPRPIGSGPVEIGRAVEDRGITLSDPRASRRHAVVTARANGQRVILADQSRNGTFVNGRRVEEAELYDGDVIRVGDSFLMLRYLVDDVEDASIPAIVGRAPVMQLLRRTAAVVAPTDATALVVGPSGTGKELVARAIHELSGRRGPFVPVNCSAIPATLAESQLFGHEAGAFTGARAHGGLFRAAFGGTLFLDEVGELPADVQPKLLRVLEERCVTPVGSSSPVAVNVRVVTATNRELDRAVDEGLFRGDVYARLAEITIRTPRLVERREDILPLFRAGYGGDHPPLAPALVEALLLHDWPFNVRELFKVATELRIKGSSSRCLELRFVEHRLRPGPSESAAPPPQARVEARRPARPKEAQPPSRAALEAMLRECEGNVSKLARLLGRSRRQVYRYLESYGLDIEGYRS